MHEFSMTQQIVRIILAEAEKQKCTQILEVVLEIGEFSFLIPEQVLICYETIVADNRFLKDSELLIANKRGEVACTNCEYAGKSKNDGTILCPSCDHPTKIVSGRDCIVKTIKMQ